LINLRGRDKAEINKRRPRYKCPSNHRFVPITPPHCQRRNGHPSSRLLSMPKHPVAGPLSWVVGVASLGDLLTASPLLASHPLETRLLTVPECVIFNPLSRVDHRPCPNGSLSSILEFQSSVESGRYVSHGRVCGISVCQDNKTSSHPNSHAMTPTYVCIDIFDCRYSPCSNVPNCVPVLRENGKPISEQGYEKETMQRCR
jgi:hypothetical protein